MAAAVILALTWRVTEKKATTARLSLARTALSSINLPRNDIDIDIDNDIDIDIDNGNDNGNGNGNDNGNGNGNVSTNIEKNHDDFDSRLEMTEWGPARRRRSPASVNCFPLSYARSATSLGSTEPQWATN